MLFLIKKNKCLFDILLLYILNCWLLYKQAVVDWNAFRNEFCVKNIKNGSPRVDRLIKTLEIE